MFKILKSKFLFSFILISIIFTIFSPINSLSNESLWWDNDWSFNQEINIPIDTNRKQAKFQPIDFRVDFNNPCWAKDSELHSIRVICLDGNKFFELESQIYDLNKIDENFINSCSIVFLIPEFSNGEEKYFIYYNDSERSIPDYKDHVSIEESYYRYEPISGYPLESYYYKIVDDTYVVYTVSQEGQFMGYNTGQHITKMLEKTTEVKPNNGDLFAAFDFKYCYEDGLFGYSSTSQKLISKEIFVDGNLMLEFGMVSRSKLNDLQTTARYKYYHCEGENSRIHVQIKHETIKEIEVYSKVNTDGIYASLQSGGVKSSSISDLNIGQILPFMHFFNEMGSITEFSLDIDPEYIPEDPDIRVLSVKDDVDLGDILEF
jgi:hypothetical protein